MMQDDAGKTPRCQHHFSDGVCVECTMPVSEYVFALEGALREAQVWREIIEDIAVVNWAFKGDGDARKEIHGIVAQVIREQLDPVISEQAAKLREAEAKVAGAQSLLLKVQKLMTDGEWSITDDRFMRSHLARWLRDYALQQPKAGI